MRDESLIEPFAVQEFYVDGFAGHKVRNGDMFCAGFRFQEPSRNKNDPLKVIQVRLIFPVAAIASSRELGTAALMEWPGAAIRDFERSSH